MREQNVPQDLLTLHVVDTDDSLVIYMVGECDIETVPELMDELSKAVKSGKNVILDVHLLTYMDSTGISAIASANESLSEKNKELSIVGSHGIFSKIIKLTRLDHHYIKK
jgi:anti-anti-sigma factor